jgi:transposase
MNNGKYVFSQVVSFLNVNDFIKCVKCYNGNYKVLHFTCWHQLMCLLFGQLSNRESLSDLMICLTTQQSKWYHLGMGTGISKSNLAYANEHRDWRIFADYAYSLIAKARTLLLCKESNEFEVHTPGNVYAIDSTTIDLCLSVFWWAKFRQTKAAVRIHTQFDIQTNIPTFIHLTDGTVHDVNFLDQIVYEPEGFYVLDRGYFDFSRLYVIHQSKAFFVTRLKHNISYRRLYSAKVDKAAGVLCDQTIRLTSKDYPEKLRRIKYYDAQTNIVLEFMTNNFSLSAADIALLYKYRWSIELFFKWIKQHLKVKSFWGYSENAVRIQIYTAIIAYVTVAIIKEELKIKYSNYEILQILSLTLLNKTQLEQLFEQPDLQTLKNMNSNQLNLI